MPDGFMPALIFVVMMLLAAGHALVLLHHGDISLGAAVVFLGLFAAFRGALQTGSASTGFINAGRAAAPLCVVTQQVTPCRAPARRQIGRASCRERV